MCREKCKGGRRCLSSSRGGKLASKFFGSAGAAARKKCDALPDAYKEVNLRDRAAFAATTNNPLVAEAALNDSQRVKAGIAKSGILTPAQQLQLAGDVKPSVRYQVAANDKADPAVLATLAGDKEPRVRETVARHKAAPEEALIDLLADPRPDVKAAAAGNPCAPEGELRALLDDPRTPPRAKVNAMWNLADRGDTAIVAEAADKGTPAQRASIAARTSDPAIRSKLLADRTTSVRELAFRNRKLPEIMGKDLDASASDSSKLIRREVAKRSTDPSVLEKLALDGDRDVRGIAACRDELPDTSLERLVIHNDDAAWSLSRRHGGPENLPAHLRPADRRAAAIRDGSMEPDRIVEALTDPSKDVRTAAAYSRYLPADATPALADHPDDDVRRIAAGRVGLPSEMADKLSKDTGRDVRATLAGNRAVRAEIRERLALKDPEVHVRNVAIETGGEELRARFLASADPEAHEAVAVSGNLTANELTGLASSPSKAARLAVLAHRESGRLKLAKAIMERDGGDPDFQAVAVSRAPLLLSADALVENWSKVDEMNHDFIFGQHQDNSALMSLASKSRSKESKRIAARSGATPVKDLERLSKLKDEMVRLPAQTTLRRLRGAQAAA